MTRLPHENWNVKGADGPKYKVGPKCSVPECGRWADHAHHIWRRSFLAGDYKWVKLWDGTVVQNLTGLCYLHHEQVTLNGAGITYHVDGTFTWASETDDGGLLDPQPVTLEQLWTASNLQQDAMQLTVDGREVPHEHVTEEPACPTCGRKKKTELPPGPKRPRASWTVSVPKDERENGADVLDTLEIECAKMLGREEHSSHKYFVLCEVMAFFLQSLPTNPIYTDERVHEEDGA